MSRTNFGGPKLPRTLLDQVQGGRVSKGRKELSRKDRRQQERRSKKQSHGQLYTQRRGPVESDDESEEERPVKSAVPRKDAKPTKSILKRLSPPKDESSEEESEDDEPAAPVVSRAVKSKLEDDDAEIAALEKKLGMKKKKSKKTGDAELDWLVYGSDGDDENSSKRKRPEDDEWLQSKRRKAKKDEHPLSEDEEDGLSLEGDEEEEDDDGLEDLANPFSEDEVSEGDEDDFEGFDEEASEDEPAPVKQKENPYVAPVSRGAQPAKYVPPSLRKPSENEEEELKQLRRQIQGQLNRLSEANMLSILQSMQDFYTKNARQHVTSLLIELLVNLVCDPSVLNDTFLILHAGFAAAVYRTVGIDFGAQLLESLVLSFDTYYKTAAEGKQALNLMAFLSNLYAFHLVGSEIMFDYIRMLLDKDHFSETSTELLLRVIRMTGTQLRTDDPSALKDIVLLLNKTVSAIGQESVSVRTKFMIETIHDLKNNRMKTGLSASALTAEHMQRMKKTLGSVKSPKVTEPLRIGLADIRDSDKKGKWWLVGASWKDPAKMAGSAREPTLAQANDDAENESGSDSDVDLDRVARAQGMNTDVRRAIFVAVTGAVDYTHAHMRVMKLNLKNKQLIEVPRVLVHCIGAEPVYNHFYTLVATKFCGDHKLRKAYHFALLDIFRRMGETKDGEDDDEEDDQEQMSVRKIFNIAKMYATLIAEGLLHITILKTLDFGGLKHKTRIFVEALLTSTFLALRKKAHKDGYEKAAKGAFAQAHGVPDMIPGLKYYLENIIPESEIAASKKEKKIVRTGCEYAVEALEEKKIVAPVDDDLSE